MLRGIGCINHYICNVITREWLYPFIDVCTVLSPWQRTILKLVSTKPGFTLVTRTAVCAKSMRRPSDIVFTAALVAQYTLIDISCITGYAADINDVIVVMLNHRRYYHTGYVKESLDIGINHYVPVFKVAFILLYQDRVPNLRY